MVTENLHIRVCIINALNLSPKFTLITPIHKTLSASAPDTLSGSVPWTWWGTFIPPRDAPFSKSYSAPLSAYCVNNMPISRSLGKSAVVSASLALSPSLHVCVCVCATYACDTEDSLERLQRVSCSAYGAFGVKPRPHQQQCRSNIVECYNVECCFDIVASVNRALAWYHGRVYDGVIVPPPSPAYERPAR